MKSIDGYKSYIVAVIAILTGIVAYLNGEISVGALVEVVFSAAGLATVRHAIAKTPKEILKK